MGIIKELDLTLANKIAAGEVIERPASVVKELVENAIDAGSTVIHVEVEEAGLNQIKVTDNGSGIMQEDIPLAFGRHATSKIKDNHDLFHIRTLGFRGEALASITSVSKVTLKTYHDGETGHLVRVENNEIVEQGYAPAKRGTEITVASLFYNTPARLKYVKSLHTELGKITDIMNRFSMSYPQIRFELVSDGNTILQTTGNGKRNEVMAEIYGMKIARDLLPIEGETGDYKVSGMIAKPEHTRANRHYMSLFINGRYIKNFMLTKAVMQGYHTLLPIGRYPIIAIEITMDPALVDVNVHPTKQEVRLSKEAELMELIESLIKEKLLGTSLIPKVDVTKNKVLEKYEQQRLFYQASQLEQQVKEPADSHIEAQFNRNVVDDPQHKPATNNDVTGNNVFVETDTHELKVESDPLLEVDKQEHLPVQPTEEVLPNGIPDMEVVGQVHGTYIIAQNETGMYMIDQHAAQERIKYEFFKHRMIPEQHQSQSLLVPIHLSFTNDEVMRLSKIEPLLQDIGLELETFGGRDYIVNAVPVWFPADSEQTIKEIIEYALTHHSIDINKFREETAIMMSCKKSIKANHYLRKEDMEQLLSDLRQTNEPYTCPHGRPIVIQFTSYDLEKLFKRVM